MKTTLLYAAIFVYFGCIFVFAGYVLSRFGVKQLENYIQTPATVLSASIKTESRHPENRRSGPSVAEPYWVLEIEYRYELDGHTYIASDVSNSIDKYQRVDRSTHPPIYMSDLVEKYPINAQINVFVNPKRHSNAYLMLDKQAPTSFAWVGFVLFVIASLILVIRRIIF